MARVIRQSSAGEHLDPYSPILRELARHTMRVFLKFLMTRSTTIPLPQFVACRFRA